MTIVQYIIIGLCVIAAVWYVGQRIAKPFIQKECDSNCGCASGDLRKELKS